MSNDLWRGKRVVWRHKPSGGYGYVMRIPVTVVETRGKMVVIQLESGVEIVVRATSIIQPDSMIGIVPTLELTPDK